MYKKKLLWLPLLTLLIVSNFSCKTKSSIKDGSYEATNNGFNGPLQIKTIIENGKIKQIDFLKNYESFGVQRGLQQLKQDIIEQQTFNCDVVSGATFASRALLSSVKDCLKQAGVNENEFNKKFIRGKLAKKEYHTDVLVIGAGGAGLSAAVAAVQKNAPTIIVEKLGFTGGSTIFSGGALNAADPERGTKTKMTDANIKSIQKLLDNPSHDEYEKKLQDKVRKQLQEHLQKKQNWLFDSVELHALQTYSGGDYKGNPKLIDTLTQNALSAVNWLADIGAKWQPKLGSATGSLWQRSHYGVEDTFPNGAPEIFPATKFLQDSKKAEIHLYTSAKSLSKEGNDFILKADNKGQEITYHAKSVILATGGFGANVKMREKYNQQWANLGETIGCSNQNPAAQGDGIKLAEQMGANLIDMGLIQLHPNGEEGTGMMMGQPHTSGLNRIFVNNEGKRFVAEDARRDVLVNAIYKQNGSNMWIIADGNRYPEGNKKIANFVTLGKTFKANTIAELAKLINVDANNLQASIDQYNATVDGQNDPFGLKTFDKKLGVPPFYAAKRIPTVHHTMGGIQINTNAEVIDKKGNIIHGLYAAGEVTGNIHGANRLGGNALVDIVVFGKIAGTNAATINK